MIRRQELQLQCKKMSEIQSPRLLALGDSAWTIEFGSSINPLIHSRVQGFCAALRNEAKLSNEILEYLPSFRSVTIYFDAEKVNASTLGSQLLALAQNSGNQISQGRKLCVPVCFENEFGPDLEEVAQLKNISKNEVIELMTSSIFSVYMIGFLPGFPYLGGLPEKLNVPRLATPRTLVPAGSIAIAAGMCAAYPWDSPGGWRLLGQTPIPLFNANNEHHPALIAPGDQIQWRPINKDQYSELKIECQRGNWERDSILVIQDWS
ncbi:MAG: 5-oxoprolinase subunit PxpB [Polynucleobacter sp.]|nr:5-oxoprolinase subunit PxpB [Polynucleobacter sp.]